MLGWLFKELASPHELKALSWPHGIAFFCLLDFYQLPKKIFPNWNIGGKPLISQKSITPTVGSTELSTKHRLPRKKRLNIF